MLKSFADVKLDLDIDNCAGVFFYYLARKTFVKGMLIKVEFQQSLDNDLDDAIKKLHRILLISAEKFIMVDTVKFGLKRFKKN